MLIILQGTKADGAIARMFVGKMKSYVKCVNVDYESARTEEFNGACQPYTKSINTHLCSIESCLTDIQLNVKGMKTLRDSFRDSTLR